MNARCLFGSHKGLLVFCVCVPYLLTNQSDTCPHNILYMWHARRELFGINRFLSGKHEDIMTNFVTTIVQCKPRCWHVYFQGLRHGRLRVRTAAVYPTNTSPNGYLLPSPTHSFTEHERTTAVSAFTALEPFKG